MASETLQMQNESQAAAISASQLVHFLCRYPPFSFLPEDELRALTPHISRVAFPADTVVFTQGESQVDGLYVIQSGAAERYFEQNRGRLRPHQGRNLHLPAHAPAAHTGRRRRSAHR